MSRKEGKLTATDVLALINSTDASLPSGSALITKTILRKAVDLGESAFSDQATFSAVQRVLKMFPASAWPKPSIEKLSQMTPEQMREARKLLNWSRERLAALSDATASFILAYENKGQVATMPSREPLFDGLAAIRIAFEAAGVTFTNGKTPGVKLARQTNLCGRLDNEADRRT